MKGFDPIQMLTTVYFVYMLVCGERTGAVVLWLPSYHLSGCCTLVVVRRDSLIVKPFGCTVVHMKVLYKCLIHSYCFCQWKTSKDAHGV